MSNNRRQLRDRHRLHLEPRRRVLVVCCGLRTERDYLESLRRVYPFRVTVKIEPRGDSPLHCMEHAASIYGTADPAFDEVWCVFDVDQFDMGEASRRARKVGVTLAVSNPCFELWLLLHLVDATRPFADCRDVMRALTKELPAFSKSRLNFDIFRPGVDKAVDRAKRLDERAGASNGLANPSSGMWRLVARIVGEV